MLSIVVPVYKVEKYLHQCVDSILCQTFRDFELILVDDGSPDRCPQICDEYALQDTRVHVIHKENGGVQSAVIEGVKASKGEYIGFVDSDDWIEPEMYEMLMEKMAEYNLDCAICGCREAYENEEGVIVKIEEVNSPFEEKLYVADEIEELKKKLLPNFSGQKGMRTVRWDKVFRRNIIVPYILSADKDIVYGEDSIVVFPTLMACNKIYIIADCLYDYRKRANAATMSFKHQYILGTWKVLDKYWEYENFIGNESLTATTFYVCIHQINLILDHIIDCKEKRRYISEIINNNRVQKMLSDLKHIKKNTKLSFKAKVWKFILSHKLIGVLMVLK